MYKEYSKGLRTQPCGSPVLRMNMEVLLPILTDCVLWIELRVTGGRQESGDRTSNRLANILAIDGAGLRG